MEMMRNYIGLMRMAAEMQLNWIGVQTRDDRGAVSTEMAVVIGAMVAIAVGLSAIFIAKARSNANNIPDTVPAPT